MHGGYLLQLFDGLMLAFLVTPLCFDQSPARNSKGDFGFRTLRGCYGHCTILHCTALFLKKNGRSDLFIVGGYGARRVDAEGRIGGPALGGPRELMF